MSKSHLVTTHSTTGGQGILVQWTILSMHSSSARQPPLLTIQDGSQYGRVVSVSILQIPASHFRELQAATGGSNNEEKVL